MPLLSRGQRGLVARPYKLWRQVIEYFDAYLIGLTATPD
jgi:type I site-specific restriction endonuclease